MDIKENVSLREHTTLRVGGTADYFCVARSLDELKGACAFARERALPVFVLGGGSNSLVHDQGFRGLVIKVQIKGIELAEDKGHVLAHVAAGEDWDAFVERTVAEGAWGLENLSLIPGTVGAAPIQNIGAYGVEVKSAIECVHTIDIETGAERAFSKWDCKFDYRESVFKTPEHKRYVVHKVSFRLSKEPKPVLTYKDVKEHFDKKGVAIPTQKEMRDAVIEIRRGKFPDLAKVGTAGSFWKNPIISREHYLTLLATYPDMPSYPANPPRDIRDTLSAGEYVKVPLAWILDNVCNLKGYQKGVVGLFEKQPLVLVVGFGATSAQIDDFADDIATIVRDKTGIDIEREVQFVK